MKRRRRQRARKRNPTGGDHVGYWVAFFAIATLGVVYWSWNRLTPEEQKKALPGG